MRSSRMRSSCLASGAGSTSPKRRPRAATPANKPVKYSFCSGVKPALARGSGRVVLISINVALITLLGFQLSDESFCLVGGFSSCGLDDLVQCLVNVARHAGGVSADIKVRAIVEPSPHLSGVLQHSVLHIELLGLIAREREVKAGQQAVFLPEGELRLVKKIRCSSLIAKEKPVFAGCPGRLAVLEEGAERGNAGSRTDHDHRRVTVGGRPEVVGGLHE